MKSRGWGGQCVSIPYGHHHPCKGTLPLHCQVMRLTNCHRLPCFVSWRIVKMSSPNLNIVTLLGSGLTYTSAYLFGIQEQSLPSGDSVEKLIQVNGGVCWDGCLHTQTHLSAHRCCEAAGELFGCKADLHQNAVR